MIKFQNLCFLLAFVFGLSPIALAFDIPPLTGPVIDEVGLLNDNTKRQLINSLQTLKQQQNVQIQIYVTKSLQDEVIESAAIKIFDKWKLGDEKTDKGLLFLIAPNEKRIRIEVGQGLEGDIPDVIAKRIISDVVRPYFQRKEFNLGVVQGVAALQTYIGNPDAQLKTGQVDEAQDPKAAKSTKPWIILIAIGIWLVIFMFNPSLALYLLFSMMRGGGGGGGGGGSWSGGGGKSSGGGASGGW